jgi:tetratricopeptide (TPR) repeat protein
VAPGRRSTEYRHIANASTLPAISAFMLKSFLTITSFLFLLACNSKGQTNVDKDASQKAFKEGAQFYSKSLGLTEDTTTFISLSQQAIQKFELAYRYDTTNRDAWTWLSDCYYNIGEFEKAIYWSKKDMDFVESDSILSGGRFEDVGLSFLNLGEFEQAKANIQIALRFYKGYDTGIGLLIERVKNAATHIYNRQDPKQIVKLQSKRVDPCKYSLVIYEYAVKLYQDYYKFNLPSDETILKTWRENCR